MEGASLDFGELDAVDGWGVKYAEDICNVGGLMIREEFKDNNVGAKEENIWYCGEKTYWREGLEEDQHECREGTERAVLLKCNIVSNNSR